MDSTRAQQGVRRVPARYQSLTEEDDSLDEGEGDDAWPSRPLSSARRYQSLVDVRTETGRVADVQGQQGRRSSERGGQRRQTLPPRRAARETSAHVSIDEKRRPDARHAPTRSMAGQRRVHWLVFVGLALCVMILSWLALSAAGSWWQTTQDDWRYGRPRTFQVDQVVGHRDSLQHPSHFIAMNLDRHILVIEIPGGDIAKSVIFSGPTLLGPGQDLIPVTLSFQDINHDGRPDMIVDVQGSQFVYLNENGTFLPASQNPDTPG